MISDPMEDYLAAIYRAQQNSDRQAASTSQVADLLGVSAASATSMFQKLAEADMVEYREYAGAVLTQKGEKEALDIIRRHRLAERFLTDILEISWNEVDVMAHKMEHALPKKVIENLDKVLGSPSTCPHGYPIPDKNGTVTSIAVRELFDLDPGETTTIVRVLEGEPEVLTYLAKRNMKPGRQITVVEKEPVDNVITLKVAEREFIVGEKIARSVLVE